MDAVTLLTRVPLGARVHDDSRITRAVPWFPVVGAAIGLAIAGLYAAALIVLPALVAAAISVSCGLLFTGALHEDGLGDVADAFAGGADREDRLRILKDPQLGTYGVLAVVASMLIRVASVSAFDAASAVIALPAAHALSRAAAVGAMIVFRPIDEGLGASYARDLGKRRGPIGIVCGLLIACGLIGAWAAPAVVIAALAALVIGRLARSRIGGVNGDVLGAIEQASEIALLVMFVAVVARGGHLGWWQ